MFFIESVNQYLNRFKSKLGQICIHLKSHISTFQRSKFHFKIFCIVKEIKKKKNHKPIIFEKIITSSSFSKFYIMLTFNIILLIQPKFDVLCYWNLPKFRWTLSIFLFNFATKQYNANESTWYKVNFKKHITNISTYKE